MSSGQTRGSAAEQHDVSADHPDVVRRLKGLYDKTVTEAPEFERPSRFKTLRRLKGGRLEYDASIP